MKKYFYIAVAIITGIITSCTDNDEISIIQRHDMTLNINTAKTYEAWTNNTGSFEGFLGNNPTFGIGVTTLIYNSDGMLCDSLTSVTKTFQPVTQSVSKLVDGVYDVITFETFVNTDNDNQSTIWVLKNVSNIDSVRIEYNDIRDFAYWYEVFGVAHSKITVGENQSKFNIEPQPVGCLIDVAYENFTKSSYNYLGLQSRNCAEGYKLTPELEGKNRYYYGPYDKANIWDWIGYFYSGTEPLTDSDSFTCYTFETGARTYLFGVAEKMWIDSNTFSFTTGGSYNFENGKWYKAYCYYKGKPTILDTYVGLHSDFSSWYNKLDKTMNPIFAEPCTNWGATVAYVKSFMKGYEIIEDISLGEYSYYMVYSGKYSEWYIEYDFETKTSGLYNAYLSVLDEDASEEDILVMLNSLGYEYDQYYEEGGYHLFYNDITYVAVFSNLEFDDGTKYTTLQYLSRAYEDGDAEQTSAKIRAFSEKAPLSLLKNKGNHNLKR